MENSISTFTGTVSMLNRRTYINRCHINHNKLGAFLTKMDKLGVKCRPVDRDRHILLYEHRITTPSFDTIHDKTGRILHFARA